VKIDHVALYVNDLEAAQEFFTRYLGAMSNGGYHNPRTGFRSYFLCFEDGARIEVMNRPLMADGAKDPLRTGYSHIAFRAGSKEKVDALTARMRADGYEVISGPRTTGDGYYESCVIAMEGNQIEIVA
jgi:lactoylglutathione lyase